MYIAECRDGSFYTGSTGKDPEIREWEHNHDPVLSASYTRRRRPIRIVYVEQFDRIESAFHREKQVQGWSRAKKQALIDLRGTDLPALSRSRNGTATDASTSSATGTANDASTSSATGTATDASTSSATGTGHEIDP